MADWSEWKNLTLLDRDGLRIGTIEEVWPEEGSERRVWGMVSTRAGYRSAYLPDAQLVESGDEVVIVYTERDLIEGPEVDLEGELSDATAQRIAEHVVAARPPGPSIGRPRPRPPKRPPGSASTGTPEPAQVIR